MLVEGVLTRSGVFIYHDADGKERREYRPPDEVFKADSMNSFQLVPLTNGHPPEQVTAQNARKYSVGAVGAPRRDGDFMVAPIAVFDAAAVADVEAGKRELSNGYFADVVDEAGVSPEGERYDAVQRDIVGNHVAIVDAARAGHVARIRMDGAAVMVSDAPARVQLRADAREEQTMKVRIDGVEYDVSEQVAQAIAKQDAAAAESLKAEKSRADAATADAAKEKARADGLDKELTAERKAKQDLETGMDERVQKRVAFERQAAAVLGEKEVAGKSERAVKLAVVKHVDGEDLAADAHEAYLQGRYDSAVKRAGKSVADLAAARAITRPDLSTGRVDGEEFDEEAAARRMRERTDAKWKNPAAKSANEEK